MLETAEKEDSRQKTQRRVLSTISVLMYALAVILCFYFFFSHIGLPTTNIISGSAESPNVAHDYINGVYRRDDDASPKKSKSVLDLLGVRIVIGIGVFAFINAVAITVHHIVQKVSRSTSTYREVDHVYSPY